MHIAGGAGSFTDNLWHIDIQENEDESIRDFDTSFWSAVLHV